MHWSCFEIRKEKKGRHSELFSFKMAAEEKKRWLMTLMEMGWLDAVRIMNGLQSLNNVYLTCNTKKNINCPQEFGIDVFQELLNDDPTLSALELAEKLVVQLSIVATYLQNLRSWYFHWHVRTLTNWWPYKGIHQVVERIIIGCSGCRAIQ